MQLECMTGGGTGDSVSHAPRTLGAAPGRETAMMHSTCIARQTPSAVPDTSVGITPSQQRENRRNP
jgi:hypothetical protein